ncbi:hypothetical protein ABPG75_008538 [Micractinium tetrahymenae]
MVKLARGRRRGGASPQRWLVIAVLIFIGVNGYFLLRRSGSAKSTGGEGGHRYRQTEQHEDIAAAGAAAAGAVGGGTAASDTATCHAETDAEYDGEKVVTWGAGHQKDSWADCCAACKDKAPDCNVWVYCDHPQGCSGNRPHKECWLKHKKELFPPEPKGRRAPGCGWVSGAVYSEAEREALLKLYDDRKHSEDTYLERLRANESLPLVYLDVEIKGKPVGRIEMVLFPDISPRAAENFRQLCTGESGRVPDEEGREGRGKLRHFKGAYFYRIIDQFIDQTGVETESVFGGQFKDDPGGLQLKHDRKGLLSMANMGHDTNTAHFSIMMGPAPHLNGGYTIFGQVVRGMDVVDAINALSKGKKDNTATQADGAQIVDSGQIRKGTIVPDLTLGS